MEGVTPTKENDDNIGDNSTTAIIKSVFLTPSASNICIVCHRDVTERFKYSSDGTRKRKLWSANNQKTDICKLLEGYLDVEVSRTEDFQCICTSCSDKVRSGVKSQKVKRDSVFSGRELASAQFLRTRSYTRRSVEPPSKKQLLYSQKTMEPQVKIEITSGVTKTEYSIPEKFIDAIKLMEKNDTGKVICALRTAEKDSFDKSVLNWMTHTIEEEVKNLCSNKEPSSFKLDDVGNLENITYQDHYNELTKKSPSLLHLISKVAIRPDTDRRNSMKTSDTLKPSIVNVIGCLLFARNQKMNANALRNSLMLRRGKADKICFRQFQKLSITLDHTTVLRKQTMLAKENFTPVLQLKKELQIEVERFRGRIATALFYDQNTEIILHTDEPSAMRIISADADESFFEQGAINPKVEIIDVSFEDNDSAVSDTSTYPNSLSYLPVWKPRVKELEVDQSVSDIVAHSTNDCLLTSKYVFVGDNVDIRTKRRQYSINRSNVDRHLYNLMVVKNRISIPQHLVGMKALTNISLQDIPFTCFIPTENDELLYKYELKILILRDLIKHVDDGKWMKKYVVNHIPHSYVKEASQVSVCFPLGILDKNEATTEGIIDIMREQHLFVPGHDTDHPLRMLSFGDLLTVERQENAQEDLRDHSSPSARLEGLIPALADFHTYGNFFEVIWHLLYNPGSSNDVGTLFQARNFLNARAVPSSPMDNINACEELLQKYSEALLITAFQQLLKDSEFDTKEPEGEEERKKKVDDIISLLVERFLTPKASDDISNKSYNCPYCQKSYKKVKSLRNHIKEKHKGERIASNDDSIHNYSVNALSLCYLAKNFNDARKHGDGTEYQDYTSICFCISNWILDTSTHTSRCIFYLKFLFSSLRLWHLNLNGTVL